ncbi:MAG TPA: sugar ABC transporter permease [Propionibacteriaceae bacterium]|jgi:D-xylose transport system permease protein|nr:sugar ABC transporter permease [Propionibacteriaceae bacterium]
MSTEAPDTTEQAAAVPEDVIDPRLMVREHGLRGYWVIFRRRVRGGELGALPVVIGLIVIWTIFYIQEPRFLSAQNLTNLVLQATAVGLISVGIVLVLLLGEIDLSVGSVSGLCACVLAVLNIKQGWPAIPAILVAILVGALIGLIQGSIFTRFGVPSFVVTLAGLIGWQGVQLAVLGETGTINFPFDGPVAALTNTFFPPWVGYLLVLLAVGAYVGSALIGARRRAAAGLLTPPLIDTVLKAVGLGVLLVAAVLVFNSDRGTPLALLIFVGFVVFFDLILRRTRYGRSIFAVGGNVEAARRAGINVSLVRVTAFVLCSTMAAIGGILAASRLLAAGQSSGGGETLLYAIAAAVIGGTSLFGGRGSTYSALLGILVIFSIANGMDLLGLESSIKFMITGAVLLAAVILDAVARRGRAAHGRA